MSHSVRPSPGWYADPEDPSLVRWWNGTQWSQHTQPLPSGVVITEPHSDQAQVADGLSVRSDLGDAPSNAPVEPPPAKPSTPPASPAPGARRSRRRAWVILTGILTAVCVGAVIWFFRSQPTTEASASDANAAGSTAVAPDPAVPADAAIPGACSDVVSALTADGTATALANQLQAAAAGADLAEAASFLASIGPVTNDLLANSGAACVTAIDAGQGPAAFATFVNSFQGSMNTGTQIVNAGLAQQGGLSIEQQTQLGAHAVELTAATAAVARDVSSAPAAPPAG